MKISSIYGKKTISVAGNEGYVLCVYFDGFNITGFRCADNCEKEFFVCADSVKSIKDKLIYKLNGLTCGCPLKLGKPVFDCEGKYIGKLTDLTVENFKITIAHVGNKKFSADDIVLGDCVILRNSARILKSDVKKNGKILIRRGTPLTADVLKKAQEKGEYVQTNLKSI